LLGCLLLLPGASSAQEQRVYRLGEATTYQEGCVSPCLCPIRFSTGVEGTFVLGPFLDTGSGALATVDHVNWYVSVSNDKESRVTGGGVLRASEGAAGFSITAELELSIDSGEPLTFISEPTPATPDLDELAFEISLNDAFCYDIAFSIAATAVPADQVVPYRLLPASFFQQGCFDICECLVEQARSASGILELVLLEDLGTVHMYAVARAAVTVEPLSIGNEILELDGVGRYEVIDGYAGPIHSLELFLADQSDLVERYFSELANTDFGFPESFTVTIGTGLGDQDCFERFLHLEVVVGEYGVFSDGFESGNTGQWSSRVP